jgi:hypothetical protein
MRKPTIVPLAASLAIIGAAACQQPDDTARDTLAGVTTAADTGASCLPVVPDVRGTLIGQRELGQREARRVRVVGEGVQRPEEGGATVTIAPVCGSHLFRPEDLARGQFVARLTIDGMAPRFSRFANDTVYWWVYLDLTSGVPVYRSEFLSTMAPDDAGRRYVRRGEFTIRCWADERRHKTEMAGWEEPHEPEPCPTEDARMTLLASPAPAAPMAQNRGSAAWFGCTLGCCQASRIIMDEQ